MLSLYYSLIWSLQHLQHWYLFPAFSVRDRTSFITSSVTLRRSLSPQHAGLGVSQGLWGLDTAPWMVVEVSCLVASDPIRYKINHSTIHYQNGCITNCLFRYLFSTTVFDVGSQEEKLEVEPPLGLSHRILVCPINISRRYILDVHDTGQDIDWIFMNTCDIRTQKQKTLYLLVWYHGGWKICSQFMPQKITASVLFPLYRLSNSDPAHVFTGSWRQNP